MVLENDAYDRITKKIIADLEKGELTWRKPWNCGNLAHRVTRPLRCNDIPYSGINTILLWAAAAEKGYSSPYWMTSIQAAELNAHVRDSEQGRGTQVVYADKYERNEIDANGKEIKKYVSVLKTYTVFNASQIDGLPETFTKLPETSVINEKQRIENIKEFFEQTKAKIKTGFKADYDLEKDEIEMPPFKRLNKNKNYYPTLALEATHWTRHKNRLNRDFNRKTGGDEGYAKEELVAEIGACFLAADLGFEPITKENHTANIQSWLHVLKNDNHFIVLAASFAQKAVEYMTAQQPNKKLTAEKSEPVMS